MTRLALLCLPLALMSCGTPQERCISGVTRELGVVNGLIAETQANLARGYSLEEVVISTPTWSYCDQPVLVAQPDGSQIWINGGGMCLEDYTQTIERPRAIDPGAEIELVALAQVQGADEEQGLVDFVDGAQHRLAEGAGEVGAVDVRVAQGLAALMGQVQDDAEPHQHDAEAGPDPAGQDGEEPQAAGAWGGHGARPGSAGWLP